MKTVRPFIYLPWEMVEDLMWAVHTVSDLREMSRSWTDLNSRSV